MVQLTSHNLAVDNFSISLEKVGDVLITGIRRELFCKINEKATLASKTVKTYFQDKDGET